MYNYTKDWIYDENAPWTTAAESENDPSMPQNKIRKQIFVPPLKDWFFYRGDKVCKIFRFFIKSLILSKILFRLKF